MDSSPTSFKQQNIKNLTQISNTNRSLLGLGVTLAFMFLNLACVQWTFTGHIGLEVRNLMKINRPLIAAHTPHPPPPPPSLSLQTPKGRSEVPRNICLVLQFLDIAYKIGRATNFSKMWLATILAYVAAFAFAGPVTASHEKEPIVGVFFWHKVR